MATTPALPSVLAKGVRWLIKHPQVVGTAFYIVYDYVSSQDPATELLWRKVYVTYNRATPVTTVEDTAVFTLNISNITGGQLDGTWTAGDYTTVDGHIQELLTKLSSYIGVSHSIKDVRYYQAAFNSSLPIGQRVWKPGDAGDEPKRFAKMGPPGHIYIPTLASGTQAGAQLPYQVAMSVTLKTPGPKHWGRAYLPGVAIADLSASYGRFATSTQQAIADAFAEFQDDLIKSDFQLVVPTTQQDGSYATALSGVTDIVVDDIPDVIRRRRPKQPGVKATGVPTP